MGKVRVLSNRKFDVTLIETNTVIPVGISIMDEEVAKANSEVVRILGREEEPEKSEEPNVDTTDNPDETDIDIPNNEEKIANPKDNAPDEIPQQPIGQPLETAPIGNNKDQAYKF